MGRDTEDREVKQTPYGEYGRPAPQVMSGLAEEFAMMGLTIGIVGGTTVGLTAMSASPVVVAVALPTSVVAALGMAFVNQ